MNESDTFFEFHSVRATDVYRLKNIKRIVLDVFVILREQFVSMTTTLSDTSSPTKFTSKGFSKRFRLPTA